MADGDNRSYDPTQAGASGHGGADPLTELARLIGQNDPFSDFAGKNRRGSPPPADPHRANQAPNEWRQDTDPVQASTGPQRAATLGDYGESPASPAAPHMATPREPNYNDASFGDPHQVSGSQAQPYYGAAAGQSYGPDDGQDDSSHDRYQNSGGQPYYREMQSHEMYEEPAPSRRRNGLMTVIAIFALAVGGTAAALGYRAVFSSSGSVSAPPVIKADTTPSKVVPAAPVKDPNSNKLIYDRVGDRNQAERVVTREEQPVEMKEAALPAPRIIFPDPQASTNAAAASSLSSTASGLAPASPASASTSATEPKKVRTVTIRPDQNGSDAPAAPAARTAAPPSAARSSAAQATSAPPAETVAPAPAATPRPVRQTIERSQRTQPDANAPISLTPPRVASAPAARTATARPAVVSRAPATREGGPGSYVQVASQRSEAEAQASFRSVQAKFPDVLGARQPVIRRADLGDKGVYYRAQVGPLSAEQANEICSNLKAAGGQCLIQRN
ncbi:MAG: SPOR domain-containing protein [Pseudomonadota bacterium]|nr:SPOR domain-containing protein [Pseudomonadota bacterium]